MALRLVLTVVNMARLLLSLSVLLLLYAKWTTFTFSSSSTAAAASNVNTIATPHDDETAPPILSAAFVQYALAAVLERSSAGRLATRTAATTPAWALLPVSLALLYVALQRIHTEERLLVLRGLGIQTSSTSSTILGSAATRFIPTEKIQDVLVNEAFRGFEVRYYLVVVVEGEEDVVVVFPRLLPRREVVERVWRGVRRCLFEEKEKAASSTTTRNGKVGTEEL
jgi:phosphatidylinositol glycan class H protein